MWYIAEVELLGPVGVRLDRNPGELASALARTGNCDDGGFLEQIDRVIAGLEQSGPGTPSQAAARGSRNRPADYGARFGGDLGPAPRGSHADLRDRGGHNDRGQEPAAAKIQHGKSSRRAFRSGDQRRNPAPEEYLAVPDQFNRTVSRAGVDDNEFPVFVFLRAKRRQGFAQGPTGVALLHLLFSPLRERYLALLAVAFGKVKAGK